MSSSADVGRNCSGKPKDENQAMQRKRMTNEMEVIQDVVQEQQPAASL